MAMVSTGRASVAMALWFAATLLVVLLIAAAVHIGWRARTKKAGQRAIYRMASARALATGKPLVVVGDPAPPCTLNAWFGPGYGCGDLCVDAGGAPSCPPAKRRRALVLDWLREQPADSAVIFESEVLMFVPPGEVRETIGELYRVSGGDLFSSHSNAVNVARYAVTGQRQKPRALDLFRFRFSGAFPRVFLWYPPFDPGYGWVEFPGKGYDRTAAGSALH
jgi:hypothetical protein